MNRCPALFVSAPASGQGKTTVVSALARYYRDRGLKVRVFKTGPDFLDPMILARACGAPVYQLDPWMGGEDHCRQLLYEAAGAVDLILVEGVMGLFDGESSSADLADSFHIPVLAVIDASAMAQTFGAVAQGLAVYRPGLAFAGVFANRVAGESHYRMLAESLPPGLDGLGWLRRDGALALPERHLGLVQAAEVADLETRIARAGAALEGIDPGLPAPVEFFAPPTRPEYGTPLPLPLQGVRVAIARDAAFAFLYPANLDCLRSLGAEVTFFSPLDDGILPETDVLYLPGGYPELHLDTLSANHAMKAAISAHHARHKPIVAECGGMLYLFESITDARGHRADMLGILPGHATMRDTLANLGRCQVTLPEGVLRGHTFHYSHLETALAPIARSQGERPDQRGEAVYRAGRVHASYLHLYFPSGPAAVARLFSN
ncbi:MAG: hydrogenobyrinic acid a,c-diamide synthase (glutamine-hydrolysing) /cobyrinate a,c-diamide synthase [Candidatus Kentron sp. G]|nr:MAG: hydrogenobyrinic acid a,c-diamide synthase (glutamine-hydrolysing) /cobyrinate a,c-diamide synthase [Candidatus Kentron sp. G]VFN01641.1 MAG: hydrogenobyrinic acid a,c-diamide synthase (glutamine-hydrolysing) /cobyrinate a,c-diamide synthase [Candidatus Kentron sp. G]VFN03273.1 MAG: hydrogenobyrinic acid a,c-diamide synthase (glutamine-hydrolysing) /cobyrinate a,c-diamide synthase [Candidatus Kentron sp. G]